MVRTILTLTNGLRVANFSSPHPFTFTDGNILPAVEPLVSKQMSLDVKEFILKRVRNKIHYQDIVITWKMSNDVLRELYHWMKMYKNNEIDIVLIPLPVMTALKEYNPAGIDIDSTINHPFRVIRVENRITKVIHIDKFCI